VAGGPSSTTFVFLRLAGEALVGEAAELDWLELGLTTGETKVGLNLVARYRMSW